LPEIARANAAEGPVNRYDDRYVWHVSSWIDPPSSNPRRNTYAIIDPVSGEVYAVHQGGTYLAGSIVNTG
jgi:hypothetical protein